MGPTLDEAEFDWVISACCVYEWHGGFSPVKPFFFVTESLIKKVTHSYVSNARWSKVRVCHFVMVVSMTDGLEIQINARGNSAFLSWIGFCFVSYLSIFEPEMARYDKLRVIALSVTKTLIPAQVLQPKCQCQLPLIFITHTEADNQTHSYTKHIPRFGIQRIPKNTSSSCLFRSRDQMRTTLKCSDANP